MSGRGFRCQPRSTIVKHSFLVMNLPKTRFPTTEETVPETNR